MILELTIKDLEFCFHNAKRFRAKYIAVLVEMEGFPKPELIINPNENIDSKLEYYKKTYDENLVHKYSKIVKIIGFSFGDNFKELLEDLPKA